MSVKLTGGEREHHASKEMHEGRSRRRSSSSTAMVMATRARSLSASLQVGSRERKLGRIYDSLVWREDCKSGISNNCLLLKSKRWETGKEGHGSREKENDGGREKDESMQVCLLFVP